MAGGEAGKQPRQFEPEEKMEFLLPLQIIRNLLHQLDVKKADKDSIQEEMNVVRSPLELEETIFPPPQSGLWCGKETGLDEASGCFFPA